MEQLFKQNPPVNMFQLGTPVPAVRAAMDQQMAPYHKTLDEPVAGVKEEDFQVPMRDGEKIAIRVYIPEIAPKGASPLVV